MNTKRLTKFAATFAADLSAFCSAVRVSATGLNLSARSSAGDLLSLYALGALGQLHNEGLLSVEVCRAVAENFLARTARWPAQEAEARADAFFPDHTNAHGAVRRVIERGAADFDAWRNTRRTFTAFGFAELVQHVSGGQCSRHPQPEVGSHGWLRPAIG